MAPNYNVYLAKQYSDPDGWDSTANDANFDEPNGYVHFICPSLNDSIINRSPLSHNAAHVSINIITGKFTQSMTLNNLTIVNTGDTEGSDHYNAVKEFVLRHMALDTPTTEYKYPLYLHIYNPSLTQKRIKWMDNDEDMKTYCRVSVRAWNFRLDNSGVYIGTIKLEEAWG